jgi:peptidoglycan hydrolase-like protein with peptidoglycan-binding domain
MPNPAMPTVQHGDKGDAVSQAQRALRRTPNLTLEVDGVFGPLTESATEDFQKQAGIPVTGVVDQATWQALPTGLPMPVLQRGAKGELVRNLQTILTMGAFDLWKTTPQGIDGEFGSNTETSVRAFQKWARIGVDGAVGTKTWNALSALEFVAGIQHAVGVTPV